ncbi:MAG: ABC transporter ATP-binding protein [Gemmatimonadaceae bacterium]
MIELRGLGARVGDFRLDDITFTLPEGKYGVVIGPAGSGKTTLLETIAGVVRVSSGTLRLGGRDALTIPAERRGLGLVYQHGYLFPHLSVEENIAYGAVNSATVSELVERFRLGELRGRDVVSLSGGERQLVALARALAVRPTILLLDEPFSALDPRRRTETRREVRAIHREWQLTVLQVTHDFAEAGMLGDIAILLDRGRVLQSGPPAEVFRRPASPYIAEFLGAENVLGGRARVLPDASPDFDDTSHPTDGEHAIEFISGALSLYTVGAQLEGDCTAVIRAEEVVLSRHSQTTSARNTFAGRVSDVAILGAYARVTVDASGVPLVAALTARSVMELGLDEGSEVYVSFKALAVHLC